MFFIKEPRNNHRNRFNEMFREKMSSIMKQKDVKIVNLDANETFRAMQEANDRVIEFETQIESVTEQY